MSSPLLQTKEKRKKKQEKREIRIYAHQSNSFCDDTRGGNTKRDKMSGNTDAEKGNFAVKAGLAQVRDSHSRELTRFSTRCLFFCRRRRHRRRRRRRRRHRRSPPPPLSTPSDTRKRELQKRVVVEIVIIVVVVSVMMMMMMMVVVVVMVKTMLYPSRASQTKRPTRKEGRKEGRKEKKTSSSFSLSSFFFVFFFCKKCWGGFIIGGGPFFFHKTSPVTPFFCLCFVCLCRFYLSLLKKRDDAFGKKKMYK